MGNWKREKIGDRGAETRRFRSDYLFMFLLLMRHLLFGIDISSCAGSLYLRSQIIYAVMPG